MNATNTSSFDATGTTSRASTLIPPTNSTTPYFEGTTYSEQVRELEAIGGDPSFLEPPTSWDGSVDESAHSGGWEPDHHEVDMPISVDNSSSSYTELKRDIEAVGGDPSFLDEGGSMLVSSKWDGNVDESAHFGGWES